MSRVDDALRRAGQGGDEHDDPGTAEASDDSQFVEGTDSLDSHEPDVQPVVREVTAGPAAGAAPLAMRARTVPIDLVRHDGQNQIQLFDIARLLFRRWRLIAAVVAASLAIAAVYNQLATPIYQARTRLLIEPDLPDVVPFRPVTEDTGRYDYFVTQLEVLRSPDLVRKALERLKLKQLPGTLSVTPVRSDLGTSRVVNLIFTSSDPELAARTANTVAQTYVDQNLELRRQGSRDASKWLNERLAELRQDVSASQSKLQQYREQKDSVSLDGAQNIVVQKLTQLSAALTSSRTERLAQQALNDQLNAMLKSGAPLDTFPPVLTNSYIQGLKAELATLQRQRGELAERLGDLHPDMIKVDTAIATTERRLQAETDKVVEGVRNDFRAAQSREQGLAAALEAQKHEVLDLNKESIGYGALQRDAGSTQQIFDAVLQRLRETELSGELLTNNVRVLDVAQVPRQPISPRSLINLFVALIVGSFAAVSLVFGLEYLNPRITKADDIAAALGLPLLGMTPKIEVLKKGRLVIGNLPPAFQEALRGIRTRILLSPLGATTRTLAVTSTSAGEGKTVVASSLAISMAMAGRRVLLIDADMRRPQLHRVFDVVASPGLANIMAGEAKPSEALLKSVVTGLYILPAGADVASPSDLLDSERLGSLIEGFSKVFDLVVLDCPPVMALADASIMANAASSVLFVVGAGATSREGAQAAIERLTSVQARVIGVVLNKAKADHRSEYYYPYYHEMA